MTNEQEEKLSEIMFLMNELLEDNTLPRNVRESIKRAKSELESDDALDVKISSATYIIEDVTGDINLPMHARSELWNLSKSLQELTKD